MRIAAAGVHDGDGVAFLVARFTADADGWHAVGGLVGRDVVAFGGDVTQRHGGVILAIADAGAGFDLEGVEGAGFDGGGDVDIVDVGARDEVHDAGERVGAVEAALRAAQDFDAFEVAGEEGREIGLALVGAGDVDAVDEDERVVGLGAADADLGEGAGRAGLADGDAGDLAQHVGHVGVALVLDQLAAR